jgi:hypothetical protein
VRADKRVLRDFLGVGVVSHATERDGEHLRLITRNDLGECSLVAALNRLTSVTSCNASRAKR